MKTIIRKEINKLEKYFNEKDIKESWYYEVLQKMVNENTKTCLPVQNNTIKDFNIEKMKQELIEYALTLNNCNLINKLVYFIDEHFKNPYYFNIIQVIILILKTTEQNQSIEEAKNIIYQNRMDLSGFEISIINNLLPYFYIKESNNIKIYK